MPTACLTTANGAVLFNGRIVPRTNNAGQANSPVLYSTMDQRKVRDYLHANQSFDIAPTSN